MSNIINEIELSVRTSNVLKLMGDVHTLDDFMALTEGRVRAVRGAGRRTWNEIRDVQAHFRQVEKRRAAERAAEETDETVLRDWFAGKALAGLLVDSEADCRPESVAQACYRYADAMLTARKTKEDDR